MLPSLTASLIQRLIAAQHPDLSHLPVRQIEGGLDNAIFQLGDALCVRLPCRPEAAALIDHEQRWLPELAPRLPIPTPAPVRIGQPSEDYPWHWSILPWLPGEAADRAPLLAEAAVPLADFLKALHKPAPADAPANPWRGRPLANFETDFNKRLARIAPHIGADRADNVREVWERALAASPHAELWLHGDLHARNVLTIAGRISAVIDWGDLCSGDAATDLASLWMLLPGPASMRWAQERYQPDDALLERARGWAVRFGVILTEMGLDGQTRYAPMGAKTLKAVSSDRGI